MVFYKKCSKFALFTRYLITVFFQDHQNFDGQKRGQVSKKYFLGPVNIYTVIQKIFIKLDFKLNLGICFLRNGGSERIKLFNSV